MERRILQGMPFTGCEALLVLTAMLAWAGLGCSTSQPGPTTKYANVNCPISGEKIQPASVQPQAVRQFKGCNVAFSSEASAQQWDKLTDQEKQQKLDKVLAPRTAPACGHVGVG
jgi:hypothetical protein